MRGDTVYRVYGVHEGREKDVYFGTFRAVPEAEAEIAKLKAREMNGQNWAKHHHNKGFVIRETVVDTDFEIPSRSTPRDKYIIKASNKNRLGTWDSMLVDVYRRNSSAGDIEHVCRYERNHAMFQTFEPFRQGRREFALISRHYSGARSGFRKGDGRGGRRPQRILPGRLLCTGLVGRERWFDHSGSEYWTADKEWPTGDFGFVWGCVWGDDSSWKVQYLDLSRVQEGIITRDERFGYVELATLGFRSPCFDPRVPERGTPPRFIHLSKYEGIARVTFAVEMAFDLATGKAEEWQRLRILGLE